MADMRVPFSVLVRRQGVRSHLSADMTGLSTPGQYRASDSDLERQRSKWEQGQGRQER